MDLKSGYPLWLVRYGMPYDYPRLQQNIKTHVLVLGGGISGALVSYYLTLAGVSNIVADARTIGLGSTCASTSLLQYEIDTPLSELQHKTGLKDAVKSYKLCGEAIDKLEGIAEKIQFSEFEKAGSLYYAAYKKDVKFLEEEFKIRKKNGFDVKLLNEKQVSAISGFGAPAAILSGQGAQTNAYSFTHELHRFSIKKGTPVFARTCIVKIIQNKNGIKAVTEEGYTIAAKKIIYATGYESVKYIDKKIVDLNSTYAICSEQGIAADVPLKNKLMAWSTADPYLYLRTTADNRILIGGRDEAFYNPAKRDKLLPLKAKRLVKDFSKLFPKIEFKREFSWCGTFGATKDGLPFIGEYKKLPNSYFALGFGGNGITFSLIAAEILKDLITGRSNKAAAIFSFDRI